MVKVAFSFKSRGIEKIELSSQVTEDLQNLKYEILSIIDPKYIEISCLSVVNIKY